MPTDTVYGLIALANDVSASNQLMNIKGRSGKPGTMIAASVEQLLEMGMAEGITLAMGQIDDVL